MFRLLSSFVLGIVLLLGCKEHHAPTLHESGTQDPENILPIEISAEKFVLAWERSGGSFSEFESAPLSIEMAKSVVAYVHLNIMRYGLGAWSSIPTSTPKGEGPKQAKGIDYQAFSRIRRAAYKLLEIGEMNTIFEEYDQKLMPKTDMTKEDWIRETSLERQYEQLFKKLLPEMNAPVQ